jgi:hypothetical protein
MLVTLLGMLTVERPVQ